ncbi:hypothetical protein AB9E21_35520, partial [Rhizobium leguminosarum]
AYDSLGGTVQYDYYFTKTCVTTDASGAVTGSTLEVAVYRNADASTGSTTSFPYSSDDVQDLRRRFVGLFDVEKQRQ